MFTEANLVVFSHLRWDFVHQRPQHLLGRMAAEQRVLFVEEPVHAAEAQPSWELSRPTPGVLVARLRTPCPAPGFDDEHLDAFAALLPELLKDEAIQNPVAWLYTPLALPLARYVNPSLLVYDCMDELAAFHGAPPRLLSRERELLAAADLVFTGGLSLYRSKRPWNRNVHCFPSSVDADHFRAARDPGAAAPDLAAVARPRLGFYGVIDERMDLELLATVAESRPEWQIVLVGPVVKIDPDALPQYPNIHLLGKRSYEQLPAYLAGWDVALMPFAMNEATRFISPTKTLEYMAAEKPIVSTPISDVVEAYGDVVYVGATPAAFVRACETAMNAPGAERARRAARMREVLATTSWDATAANMLDLVHRALAAQRNRQAA